MGFYLFGLSVCTFIIVHEKWYDRLYLMWLIVLYGGGNSGL